MDIRSAGSSIENPRSIRALYDGFGLRNSWHGRQRNSICTNYCQLLGLFAFHSEASVYTHTPRRSASCKGGKYTPTLLPETSVHTFPQYVSKELLVAMGAAAAKRPRRWANRPQVMRLARQLWSRDWETLPQPASRVYDWAMLMADVSTAHASGN